MDVERYLVEHGHGVTQFGQQDASAGDMARAGVSGDTEGGGDGGGPGDAHRIGGEAVGLDSQRERLLHHNSLRSSVLLTYLELERTAYHNISTTTAVRLGTLGRPCVGVRSLRCERLRNTHTQSRPTSAEVGGDVDTVGFQHYTMLQEEARYLHNQLAF